jgi:hypothetical protein
MWLDVKAGRWKWRSSRLFLAVRRVSIEGRSMRRLPPISPVVAGVPGIGPRRMGRYRSGTLWCHCPMAITGSARGSMWWIARDILRRAGPFGYPILARHRRVRGVTPTRLTDWRPLPHPCGKISSMRPLSGGTRLTRNLCALLKRPYVLVNARQVSESESESESEAVAAVAEFVEKNGIQTLNVAGPRASGWAAGYAFSLAVVGGVIVNQQGGKS